VRQHRQIPLRKMGAETRFDFLLRTNQWIRCREALQSIDEEEYRRSFAEQTKKMIPSVRHLWSANQNCPFCPGKGFWERSNMQALDHIVNEWRLGNILLLRRK
jgi:hypothetical protein